MLPAAPRSSSTCGSNRAEADAVVKEIESKGGKAMAAVADVADAQAVNAMAEAALKQFGRIDYLINNAALRGEKAIEDMTFEEWRLITGVMLDGAFHCVKACLPRSSRATRARSSMSAGSPARWARPTAPMWSPPRPASPASAAALAMELAPHKITVNTLVPAMLAKPDKPNEIPAHPLYRPLLGRAAWPTDFAPLARFMVGPGARYMTGQTINVNGGTYFG